MAVTTQNSTEYGNTQASPPRRNRPDQQGGRVRIVNITFAQSGIGDANSLLNLAMIPAGRGRILKEMSRIVWTAFGAGRTLDIGHTGWTKSDGTAQVAAVDVLQDGEDVAALGSTQLGEGTNASAEPSLEFDARTPITIQAKVLGNTIPDLATVKGYIVYVTD